MERFRRRDPARSFGVPKLFGDRRSCLPGGVSARAEGLWNHGLWGAVSVRPGRSGFHRHGGTRGARAPAARRRDAGGYRARRPALALDPLAVGLEHDRAGAGGGCGHAALDPRAPPQRGSRRRRGCPRGGRGRCGGPHLPGGVDRRRRARGLLSLPRRERRHASGARPASAALWRGLSRCGRAAVCPPRGPHSSLYFARTADHNVPGDGTGLFADARRFASAAGLARRALARTRSDLAARSARALAAWLDSRHSSAGRSDAGPRPAARGALGMASLPHRGRDGGHVGRLARPATRTEPVSAT